MSRSSRSRHPYTIVIGALGLAGCLVITSCGGSTEVASSTVPPASSAESTAPTSTSPPTTAPPATTSPPTTTPATTPATTALPATTAPPGTAPATTTPPAAPTTAPAGAVPKPVTAYLTADDRLVEVDVATGETVRVVDEFFSGDGVFRGGLRLSPDRQTIWFTEGYEDSWYSCEASTGSWGRVDASTGELEVLGRGSGVDPSSDGQLLSYVTSGLCLPDPENPEFFVLTPSDRVVVRDLSTGDEREFVSSEPPADYAAPGAVLGAGFGPGGNLLVLLGDGRLVDVDIDGSNIIQDHPVVVPEVVGDSLSVTADGLIVVEFGDEGSSDVSSIDVVTGATTLLASSGAFMAVGVSADDQIVVSSFEPVTVAPGADVTVIDLPGDQFVFDLDW